LLTVEELELVELICAPDAVEVDFDVLELVLTVEEDDDDKEEEVVFTENEDEVVITESGIFFG
jgi:hypothetical protein